ncbi:DUF2599 domain-containing protein [Pseudomonas huaxiensis]|uniref:DUF2599 domain-containing protein n=1 Tax=Pseudomonas huaxiensis TaxID=2213017 RepID=UPI000DA6658E|nr:DUF2599 domain-containing protein [Pseudomonas huaxiensis]
MRKTAEKIVPLLICPLLFGMSLANAETCEETLKVVQTLYNNTVDKCGDDPASDCSGLLIRATTRADPAKGQNFDVWNPSPKGVELGSTAFSYMRKDITYANPGRLTENGYIKTPMDYLCENQTTVDALCAYPKDAWTDGRIDKGCGDNVGNPKDPNAKPTVPVEKACQDMGIKTGGEWVTHFNRYASARIPDQYQCGFGMMSDRSKEDRTLAFKGFMDARKLIKTAAFGVITEVRIDNPPQDEMPVLAFFQTSKGGGAEALKNQQDYLKKTGNYRPVIVIKFPQSAGDVATFTCASNQMPAPATPNATPGFCRVASGGEGSASGQCPDYIKSVQWILRKNYYSEYPGEDVWALEVVLNDCAKKFGPDKTDAVFNEMKRKSLAAHPQAKDFWEKYGSKDLSMRRQLICLNQKFSDKTPWYLETKRSNEPDQNKVNAANCNHK